MGEEDRAHEREEYLKDLKTRLTPEEIKQKCDYFENVSYKRMQKGDRNFIDDEAYLVYMYLREPEPWELEIQKMYSKGFSDMLNVLQQGKK